jgi:hypothetical protein
MEFATWAGLMEISRNPIFLIQNKGAMKNTRKPRSLTVEQFQALLTERHEPFGTLVAVGTSPTARPYRDRPIYYSLTQSRSPSALGSPRLAVFDPIRHGLLAILEVRLVKRTACRKRVFWTTPGDRSSSKPARCGRRDHGCVAFSTSWLMNPYGTPLPFS